MSRKDKNKQIDAKIDEILAPYGEDEIDTAEVLKRVDQLGKDTGDPNLVSARFIRRCNYPGVHED